MTMEEFAKFWNISGFPKQTKSPSVPACKLAIPDLKI